MQQIQWQDRFCLGVEEIDQAHRRLFAIVDKILDLYVEKHEDKFACVEGIKYFKAYAIKHFAEEEAYMRQIGYSGYLAHKQIHDRMKKETLPALERALYASDFSIEAVQRFIGVCIGWLTGHIMIEDRSIAGISAQKFPRVQPGDERSVIQGVILYPLREMFETDVQWIGPFSVRDTIVDGQYYELVYRARQEPGLRLILIIGEPLLLRAAGRMFGMEFYARNEIVRFAMQEIAQNLVQRAAASFGKAPNLYQLEGDRFFEHAEYLRLVQEREPQYSLLFRVGHDCFALCIDQLPALETVPS